MAGERPAPGEASWETLRDLAVNDLDDLIQIATEARREFETFRTALETYRRHLGGGGRATDMTSKIDIPSVRTSFNDRMSAVERARGVARISLWRLQIAEGTSMAEIARAWGISRQLVSRALTSSAPRRSVE